MRDWLTTRFNKPDRPLSFADLSALTISDRQKLIEVLSKPQLLRLSDTNLSLHVQSVTEDARIRKFGEPWTVDWLRSLPEKSILYDLGANIGVTALLAAENIERQVRVVAVEPFPSNFASLVKNIAANQLSDRIIALPLGLGEVTKVIPLHWASAEVGTSQHSFGEIVNPKTGIKAEEVAQHWCLCFRLDDLVESFGLPFPTHLKIDVDGGEIEILKGAQKVLHDSRCRGIQMEVYSGAQPGKARAAIELVLEAGFKISNRYAHRHPGVEDVQFERN